MSLIEREQRLVKELYYTHPGFGLCCSDEALIQRYLTLKLQGDEYKVHLIKEVQIHNWDPEALTEMAVVPSLEEWYFFSRQEEGRVDRSFEGGHWVRQTEPEAVMSDSGEQVLGWKTTYNFVRRVGDKEEKTEWVYDEITKKDTEEPLAVFRLRKE